MNSLKINVVFAVFMVFPFFASIYPQSNSLLDTSFNYYKFLPYYERFHKDSVEADIFKRNKVKSVSYFNQDYIYGKYDKGIIEEKRDYNKDGFLVKITYPGVRIYSSYYREGSEDNRLDSTSYFYDKINNKIIECYCIRKYPETTTWTFDSLGRITNIEYFSYNRVNRNTIFEYFLEQNKIIAIDTNSYHKINGGIYELSNNRIDKVLDYDDKDTSLHKNFIYYKNKIDILESPQYDNDKLITQYYNSDGLLIKEIVENNKAVFVEENLFGNRNVFKYTYRRDRQTNFSILHFFRFISYIL